MLALDCTTVCSVPGCGRPERSLGLCNAHYFRRYRTGDVGADVPISPRGLPDAERLWPRVDQSGGPDACWPWTGRKQHYGHGEVYTSTGRTQAHRLAYELAIGPIPPGLFVCHACDNPPCCNPTHLWVGTNTDNMRDAMRKGRMATGDRNGSRKHPERLRRGDNHPCRTRPETRPRGEANANARLTKDIVRTIRAEHAAKIATPQVLAERYGVSDASIYNVINRKTWKHVT